MILDLLEILQNYTDEDHQLNQQNIIEILENDYGYEDVRRQTVKDNLEKLRKLDMKNFEIGCEEDGERIVKDKKTGKEKELIIYSDFRYIHKFTQGELRLIIDSILFSKHINLSYRKELIEKLESLTSKHFKSGMNHIKSVKTTNKENKDLFFNIEELDKAITNSKKISFNYASYELEDKGPTLVARKNSKGKKREYIINPYYMVASNGRHYLICNNDPFKNASPYRIDRIKNINILEEDRKPIREVEGLGENIDLNQYMSEHIYMFGGKSEYVKLSFKEEFLDEFIDWFGLDSINFQENKDGQIIVRVKSNRMAMRKWALRYSLYVRVLSPLDLVDEIKEDMRQAMENYQ